MPDTTKIVKADLGRVGEGVQAESVCWETMSDVIAGYRGLVQSHQGVKGFGHPSKVQDGVYGQRSNDLRL